MQRLLIQTGDIQQHIRSNWKEYSILTFDKLKELTKDTILWPVDKIQYNKIWNWFKNEKKRIKNMAENATSIIDKTERAQKIFVKEEGNILQALAKLKTLDARADFLKEQLERNFLVMLDLMKAIQLSPYDTFLEELFDLCSELENSHSQVLLFIRICALYSDERIDVNQELIKRTLIELSNETIDSHAAYGLLKLSYSNELSFDQLPINTLLAFEKQYILEIQAFIRSLHGRIDFQIAQSLPDTCLVFTQPFFKMLTNRGKLLHEGIQPCYLIHVVELISYSFVTQYSLVEEFVAQFKAGCISIYGRGFDLQPLLQRIIDEEIAQNGLYFGSLSNQIKLFQQVFQLIKENKLSKQMDNQMIDELVSLDQELYASKKREYKNMGSANMEQNFVKYCNLLQKENQSQELILIPDDNITTMVRSVFKYFNIPDLNLIQLASLAMMEQQKKIFQVFGTGIGKTTLALAYMIKLAKMDGLKCFYVNDIPELCARDFKRIIDVSQKMDIKSIMIDDEDQLQTINNNQLIFLSSPMFYRLSQQEKFKRALNEAVLILDEFDLLFFAQGIDQQKLISFTSPKRLVAFTGSPLEKYHKNAISHFFNIFPVNYPTFDKINGTSNICLFQEVYPTRKLQLDKLIEFCCAQTNKTPVLVLMEHEAIKQFQVLCKKQKMQVTDFNEMNSNQIMAFLDLTFTQKISNRYSLCILNSSQGRGLDVPSSADIENAGGVATVIAQLPTSAQEYVQFKGRTNRMGNKGQHCIILWARTNLPAHLFIGYHFETTHNQEILRLNKLFQNKDFEAINNEAQKQQDGTNFLINQQQCEMKQIVIIDDNSLKVQIERSQLKSFEQEEMKTQQEPVSIPGNMTKKKVQAINDKFNKMTVKLNSEKLNEENQNEEFMSQSFGKRTTRNEKTEDNQNKRQKLE